jgi:hypothetical protein
MLSLIKSFVLNLIIKKEQLLKRAYNNPSKLILYKNAKRDILKDIETGVRMAMSDEIIRNLKLAKTDNEFKIAFDKMIKERKNKFEK